MSASLYTAAWSMEVDLEIERLLRSGCVPSQEEWAYLMMLKAEARKQTDSLAGLESVYQGNVVNLQGELEFIVHLQNVNDELRKKLSTSMSSTAAASTARGRMASGSQGGMRQPRPDTEPSPALSRPTPPESEVIHSFRFTAAAPAQPASASRTSGSASSAFGDYAAPPPVPLGPLAQPRPTDDASPQHASETAEDANSQDGSPGPAQEEVLPPGTRTLLVRNIPTRFTQDDLMRLWPADGSYDLLYMPWSSRQRRFSGLAFVNFGSAEDALRFRQQWHGQTLESHGRVKVLKVAASYGQGLEECLLGLKREFSEGMTANHLPGVFELGTGRRLDFRTVLAQVVAWNEAPMPETNASV